MTIDADLMRRLGHESSEDIPRIEANWKSISKQRDDNGTEWNLVQTNEEGDVFLQEKKPDGGVRLKRVGTYNEQTRTIRTDLDEEIPIDDYEH